MTVTAVMLTETQAGKVATINANTVAIVAALNELLAAGGSAGATLTQAQIDQLAALFLTEATLNSTMTDAVTAAVADLPTNAELAAALSDALATVSPGTGTAGVTLPELQAELNSRPVPATATDVQNAVAGISAGPSGGAAAGAVAMFSGPVPAGWQRLSAVRDFSYSRIHLGPKHLSSATGTGNPAAAFSPLTGRAYYLDTNRGFASYDYLLSQQTAHAGPGITVNTQLLGTLPSGNLVYVGGADYSYSKIYDVSTGGWSDGPAVGKPHLGGLCIDGLLIGGRVNSYTPTNFITSLDTEAPIATSVALEPPAGHTLLSVKGVAWNGGYLCVLPTSAGTSYSMFHLKNDTVDGWTWTAKGGFSAASVEAVAATSYGLAAIVAGNSLVLYKAAEEESVAPGDYLGSTSAVPAFVSVGSDTAILVGSPNAVLNGIMHVSTALTPQNNIYYAVKL